MRLTCVAEVFGALSGTAYAVAPGLFLTASHVVPDGRPVSVRRLGTAEWIDAEVAWRGPTGVDAALLRTGEDAADPSLRWGSVAASDQIACRATGFPAVAAPTGTARDSDTFCGQTVPGAAEKDGRLVIESVGGPRDIARSASPWMGISGAGVFSVPESFLLGIVEKALTEYSNNRLKVLPASVLLTDPAFRALVGDPAIHIVTRSGSALLPPYASLPPSHPDSWLLEPRYAVVAFVDAGGHLDDLLDWALAAEPFSIAAVTGSGGMGKSRLAAELADRLRREGWDAGQLNTENDHSWGEISSEHPLLIVVDYASRFTKPLDGLIKRLATESPGRQVRLLLLERRMGAWWESVNRFTGRLAEHHLGRHVVLAETELDPELTGRHFGAAMTSFGRHLGIGPVAAGDITLEGADSPLLIHAAVLLALKDAKADGGRETLLQRLLDRETTRWEALLATHKLDHLHPVQAAQLVAVASLVTPTRDELRALLAGLPEVSPAADIAKVAEWLTDLLGAENGAIQPVGPDLLVERLLETLTDLCSLTADLLADRDTITAAHRSRTLHLLSLAAQRGANSQAALTSALATHLPELVTEVDPSLLVSALAASDRTDLSLSRTAQRVAPTIPAASEWLADVRAEVYELAIVRARRRAGGRIGDFPDELLIDERARAFSDLGLLLIHLGMERGSLSRWGRALAATLEAAEIYSTLAARFGNFADRRRLAIALSQAGTFFQNLDLHEESVRFEERATEMWRDLVREDPDQKEDLAIALTNLSDSLCAAGWPGETISHSAEAIALLRAELRHGRPETTNRLERALSGMAHHRAEAGDVRPAWAAIHEAATSNGFAVGAPVESAELRDVGYLNGRAAELHLRSGDLEQARACAEISVDAYSRYAREFPANLFYFRGSLQLLLKVLDAAGGHDEAAAIEAAVGDLLVEPDRALYDRYIAEFADFRRVIDAIISAGR
jgi:tetratricopeptide (TPR) repeat protein